MNTLILVESIFGNTQSIAVAMSETLQESGTVHVHSFTDPPNPMPDDIDLLLAGAPTHVRRAPSKRTRQEAVDAGLLESDATGLREWIATTPPQPGLRVITFDTVVNGPVILTGSAARSAAGSLRKAGWKNATQGESFRVEGKQGPLVDGETERARTWARTLIQS